MYRVKRPDWYQDREWIDTQGLIDLRQNDIEILRMRDVVYLQPPMVREGGAIAPMRFPARWELQLAQPITVPPNVDRIVLYAWIKTTESFGTAGDIRFRFAEAPVTARETNFVEQPVNSDADVDGRLVTFSLNVAASNQPRMTILQVWMQGENDSFTDAGKDNWFNYSAGTMGEMWPGGQVSIPDELQNANLDDAERYNLLGRDPSTDAEPSDFAIPFNRVIERPRPQAEGNPIITWYVYPSIVGASINLPWSVRPYTGAQLVSATVEFEQSDEFFYTAQRSDLAAEQPLTGATSRGFSSFADAEIAGPRLLTASVEGASSFDESSAAELIVPHRLYCDGLEISLMSKSEDLYGAFNQVEINVYDLNDNLILSEVQLADLLNPTITRERVGYERGLDAPNLRSQEQVDGYFAEVKVFASFQVSGLYSDRLTLDGVGPAPVRLEILPQFQRDSSSPVQEAALPSMIVTVAGRDTPIDASDDGGSNPLQPVDPNGLWRNDVVRPSPWGAIVGNQGWIYGRMSPVWGAMGDSLDTGALTGESVFRAVAVSKKLRSDSAAPAESYEELVLVTYGSAADWEWRIVDDQGNEDLIVGNISSADTLDIARFECDPGREYFIEWIARVDRPSIKAVFICWPFLEDIEDFPK